MALRISNKVFIYRQIIPGFYEDDLVRLCEESWRRWGWEVIPTTMANACLHSHWDDIKRNRDNLTAGKDHPDWEMASYYKWLAWGAALLVHGDAAINGSLAIDFDIINYGFTPTDAAELLQGCDEDRIQILGEYGYSFDKEPYLRPPTPVFAPGDYMVDTVIEAFVDYRHNSPKAEAARKKRPWGALHQGADEQSIINEVLWGDYVEHIPHCPMYNSTHYESMPWREAPLVHYTNWSVAKRHVQDRYNTIMRERPPF